MLCQLRIENLAIIDTVEIEFSPGFNVLTGETGAGKSILLDALGLVLGERADPAMVRTGADRLRVNAIFQVSPDLHESLVELGVEPEEGLLYLAREVQAGGRSTARINGQPVPLTVLKSLGERLVDLHGQHEHQSLLKASSHLEFLDRWLGEPALSLRQQVSETVSALSRARAELAEITERAREREQMRDLYQFQLNEIRHANPQLGEEEELQTEERRLTHAERLISLANEVYERLMGEESAYDRIAQASRSLTEIARIDPSTSAWQETLEGALAQVEEVAYHLRTYAESIEYDPERLEQVIQRLELLKRLKRKYGDTIEAVLAYADEVEEKLDAMEHQSEQREALEAQIAELEARAQSLCAELSALRQQGAKQFAESVQSHLQELAMAQAQFLVSIQPKPMDSTGADAVEFLFSANPGEPPRPLTKIASGGEMSRVMLALKTVLANASPVPTLVFDEIDAGLGGRTAQSVAEKLSQLAKQFQVLCVTHLPQIASRADHHFQIEKQVLDGTTRVQVTPLDEEARVGEIARMLAGEPSETALQHARELLSAKG